MRPINASMKEAKAKGHLPYWIALRLLPCLAQLGSGLVPLRFRRPGEEEETRRNKKKKKKKKEKEKENKKKKKIRKKKKKKKR